MPDYTQNQSCTSGSGSGSSGGGSWRIGKPVLIINTTNATEEYTPEWECSFTECIDGISKKTCYEVKNASNIYREDFKCRTEVIAENENQTANKTIKDTGQEIVQASSFRITPVIIYGLFIAVALAILFSIYVFNYDFIFFRKRVKMVNKLLDEKVRRMRK